MFVPDLWSFLLYFAKNLEHHWKFLKSDLINPVNVLCLNSNNYKCERICAYYDLMSFQGSVV